MKRMLCTAAVFTILILVITNGPSRGADYPTKPITIINPWPPGGLFDAQGRAFASVAEKYVGKPVIVLNKSGASGMIGLQAIIVQAVPDGYSLGVVGSYVGYVIEGEIAQGRTPPFARNDLVPIGSFTLTPTLIIVPYHSPWKTLAELRILASQSNRRLKSIPDIPTVKELGIEAENHSWVGIAVPKGTPMDIVEKLRQVFRKVTEDKSFTNIIETQGDEVHFMNSAQLSKYWESESEKLAKLYKQLVQEER